MIFRLSSFIFDDNNITVDEHNTHETTDGIIYNGDMTHTECYQSMKQLVLNIYTTRYLGNAREREDKFSLS